MIERLSRFLAFSVIASAFANAAPALAAGGGLQIGASSLNLAPGHLSGTIRVASERSYPDVVQVKVFKWNGGGPQENLEPTDDLLGVPTVFTIPPNGSQVIRVALRGPNASSTEGAYRVEVQEVQSPYVQSGGLGMLLQLNFPVYVAPTGTIAREASWSAVRQGNNLLVTMRNTGTVHVRVRGFTISDGRNVVAQSKDDFTVLPGQSKTWSMKELQPASGALQVHAPTDAGAIDAAVQ